MQIKTTIQNIFYSLGKKFRPLLLYHLFFSILAFIFLAPASAWVSTKVLTATGQPLVYHQQLVSFLISPAGLAWILATSSLTLLAVFIHQSGMIHIRAQPNSSYYRQATAALIQIGRRLPKLLLLSILQVGAHLLLAVPFILILGLSWLLLLDGYDPYYLLSQKPRIFWIYCATSAPVVAVMLFAHSLLYLRWILALPILLLENLPPVQALQKSARLCKGYLRRIALLVLILALLIPLLPALLTLFFDYLGKPVLGWLPENFTILIPAVLIFVTSYILCTILASFLSTAANSLLVYHIYQETCSPAAVPTPEIQDPPKNKGLLAWSTELVLLLFALAQAGFIIHSFFDFQDQVHISAHRGSSMQAPENTIPAIERALQDGADYIEIDVRQTADGVPVLIHDRDLRRVTGKQKPVWELDLEEIRQLDAGSWFHPRFAGVRIPTLQEAIDVVGNRAKLYLEIKPSVHTPQLIPLVLEVLRANDYLDQVLIAAMQPEVLRKVHSLEPDLRKSLFVHTAIGEPDRELLDALGLRAAITSVQDVHLARFHGHELHVWTVNDRREMSRFIDMGVDNIITDRPDVLQELLQEREQLSKAGLFLVKLRHWLRE